jgi:MFS transporter, DHA3 family, macrolide efflux protein
MFVLKPLAVRPISLFWSSQLFAGIGIELYRVTLIWLAVDLAGSAGGYVVAAHSAVIMAISLLGGAWTDHWDPRRTMIAVNLLRVPCAALLPLVVWADGGVPYWLFWAVAIAMAALTACFEPALQTAVPRLAPSLAMLPAINGLFDGTRRLARFLGPALVGALAPFLLIVDFFGVVAALYLAATIPLLIGLGGRAARESHAPVDFHRRVLDAMIAGWHAVRSHALLRFALPTLFLTTAAWCVAFTLGLVLLVREMPGADARLYGVVVAAYGIGNFLANLVVGSIDLRHSGRIMYIGRLALGIGFIGMALAPTPEWLMIAAAIAAIGGPMNELPLLVRIQSDAEPVRCYRHEQWRDARRERQHGDRAARAVAVRQRPRRANLDSAPSGRSQTGRFASNDPAGAVLTI